MMKLFPLIVCLTALLASCASNTTQSRIASNGSMYSKLSADHRRLVAAGDITKGMPKDAVYLAWGSPSKIYKLEEGGVEKERWVYTRRESAPTTTFGVGYGSYPRYRRWGYNGGIVYGPPARVYIPEKTATVVFSRGKVESWEKIKASR